MFRAFAISWQKRLPLKPIGASVLALGFAPALLAINVDLLRSTGAIPPHLAGRFREPTGFQQSASGQYFVFDRRSHVVFGVDEQQASAWEIVHIGGESGRIIDPTAFAIEPNGTFVVADAPNGRERIQVFTPAGFRVGGFLLPGRLQSRVVLDGFVLNGIGSLQYTGTSVLMSQPETGALVTEYTLSGGANRTFGQLRPTGHEADRDLHLALNSGIPLVDPTGGFFFVFQTGASRFPEVRRRRPAALRATHPGARDRRSYRQHADQVAETTDRGRRVPARPADDSDRGDRSRRPAVDLVRRPIHVCVRQGWRQGPHRAIPRRGHRRAQQPVLRPERTACW